MRQAKVTFSHENENIFYYKARVHICADISSDYAKDMLRYFFVFIYSEVCLNRTYKS